VSLLAPNRDLALPNASQLFEGQCLARYGGFLDQGLRYTMVHVAHPAPLAPTHLLETMFCGTGADSFQGSAPGTRPRPLFARHLALELFTCAIGGTVADAKVFSDGIRRVGHILSLARLADMQIVDAVSVHQFRAADTPGGVNQHLMLALAQHESGDDASL